MTLPLGPEKDHMNTRISQNLISGIPLHRALRTIYHIYYILYTICNMCHIRVLMFMWRFGPVAMNLKSQVYDPKPPLWQAESPLLESEKNPRPYTAQPHTRTREGLIKDYFELIWASSWVGVWIAGDSIGPYDPPARRGDCKSSWQR